MIEQLKPSKHLEKLEIVIRNGQKQFDSSKGRDVLKNVFEAFTVFFEDEKSDDVKREMFDEVRDFVNGSSGRWSDSVNCFKKLLREWPGGGCVVDNQIQESILKKYKINMNRGQHWKTIRFIHD